MLKGWQGRGEDQVNSPCRAVNPASPCHYFNLTGVGILREKLVLILIITLSFVAGALVSSLISLHSGEVRGKEKLKERTNYTQINLTSFGPVERAAPSGVKTYLVAVTREGGGVVSPVWVKAEPGTGRILVDVENLLFWVDTQYSMRIAGNVAKNQLGISPAEYDLTYSILTNASLVGGPSAGAPLTLATMAALQNKSLKEDVIMSGSIQPDGSIGKVGGILEKAKAAEREGFEKFLVPEGQLTQVRYRQKEKCNEVGTFQICQTEYIPQKINVEEKVGIDLIEVQNISQAVNYFIAS